MLLGYCLKLTATKIDNNYLHDYDDETDELLEAMPRISENEAALLHNLLSKISVYDPQKRLNARLPCWPGDELHNGCIVETARSLVQELEMIQSERHTYRFPIMT